MTYYVFIISVAPLLSLLLQCRSYCVTLLLRDAPIVVASIVVAPMTRFACGGQSCLRHVQLFICLYSAVVVI